MIEHKCKECKWLTDENRTPAGFECVNPEKQEIWNNRKTEWKFGVRYNGRYKQPSAIACKKFEKA